jgi:ketosteroid isomerase-like protein
MQTEAGQDARTAATMTAIDRFNDAFNRHDVEGVMAAMTEDCIFESTNPPPDGERCVGQAAVRAFWERFFRDSPNARFETEDVFAAGDRCTIRWLYRWVDESGKAGHIRGVDVFRVRDGKVAEKLAYVKG